MSDYRVFNTFINQRSGQFHQLHATNGSQVTFYDHQQLDGHTSPSQEIHGNAERERTRVKTLRGAFLELQRSLPAVPPDTKLSKLDVLILATTYIAHLMKTLNNDSENQIFTKNGILHPVKKWPMRSRLYAGILSSTFPLCSAGHTKGENNQHKKYHGYNLSNEYTLENRVHYSQYYNNEYTEQSITDHEYQKHDLIPCTNETIYDVHSRQNLCPGTNNQIEGYHQV